MCWLKHQSVLFHESFSFFYYYLFKGKKFIKSINKLCMNMMMIQHKIEFNNKNKTIQKPETYDKNKVVLKTQPLFRSDMRIRSSEF